MIRVEIDYLSSDIVLFTDFGPKLMTVFNRFNLSPLGERARERGRRFVKRTRSEDRLSIYLQLLLTGPARRSWTKER